MEALVEHSARARARSQVPRGALEEVRAGVLDAGGLRARDRMAADEALVLDMGGNAALRGADVGDDRLGAGTGQRLVHKGGKRPDGSAGEDRIRARHGLGGGSGRAVDRPSIEGGPENLAVSVEARDLSATAPGGEANRPTDQADAEDG